MSSCNAILIDARNIDELIEELIELVRSSDQVGFDLETYDDAHPALKKFQKKNKKKVIFDIERTVITGFSFCGSADEGRAFYVNLSHADVENRVPWEKAKRILDAKRPEAYWTCHNAPFELTMLRTCYAYELVGELICSMQLCATFYGADTYPLSAMTSLGAMKEAFDESVTAFMAYDGGEMTERQADIYWSIAGKESKSDSSWNGYIKSISYGFGLKQAVKSWFGVDMATFKETLNGKEHMGELTGEEVCAYGADDSYWCLQLTNFLLEHYADRLPAILAFFETENLMVRVYSDVWANGMRLDRDAVERRRLEERDVFDKVLLRLQLALQQLLPFQAAPHPALEKQSWYGKNGPIYRAKITEWAAKEHEDIVASVPGPTAKEFGVEGPGPNFSFYMSQRVLFYDLMGLKPIFSKGKMHSDNDARETLLSRLKEGTPQHDAMVALTEISKVEQRMKLYLTPYLALCDPVSLRVHTSLKSLLVTRRLSSEDPNPMQLAKRGESTYVRGFFLPDRDDHVIVSFDWSQIELVLIGEDSGDPAFAAAYGQLPYKDLHFGTTVDCLSVKWPSVDEEMFARLKAGSTDVAPELLAFGGKTMEPKKAYSFWRTRAGKESNFNYWYSGALSKTGEKLNWSSEQMWEATDKYRQRFSVAEEWRQNLQMIGRAQGYIDMMDGTRRDRIEATQLWADRFMALVRANYGTMPVGAHQMAKRFIKDVQRRAGNQLVNARIQGGCSVMAKRTILRINPEIKDCGFDARFMIPIHDELLYSVRRSEAVDFIKMVKPIMTTHPDLVSKLTLDCSVAVGRTFEPWHPDKAPYGQIELDEAPALAFVPEALRGSRMSDDLIQMTLEYLKM